MRYRRLPSDLSVLPPRRQTNGVRKKKHPLEAHDRRAALQLSLITGFSGRRFIVAATAKFKITDDLAGVPGR